MWLARLCYEEARSLVLRKNGTAALRALKEARGYLAFSSARLPEAGEAQFAALSAHVPALEADILSAHGDYIRAAQLYREAATKWTGPDGVHLLEERARQMDAMAKRP